MRVRISRFGTVQAPLRSGDGAGWPSSCDKHAYLWYLRYSRACHSSVRALRAYFDTPSPAVSVFKRRKREPCYANPTSCHRDGQYCGSIKNIFHSPFSFSLIAILSSSIAVVAAAPGITLPFILSTKKSCLPTKRNESGSRWTWRPAEVRYLSR